MDTNKFLKTCKEKVAEYFNEHKDKTDVVETMNAEDVYLSLIHIY